MVHSYPIEVEGTAISRIVESDTPQHAALRVGGDLEQAAVVIVWDTMGWRRRYAFNGRRMARLLGITRPEEEMRAP